MTHLREIATLFLRLGVTAFGGPAAHIAMMEEECVRKRAWLTHHEFIDLLGATNLIPGPNSTEMAMHIGQRRAGWRGLVVAGVCFIVPAALLTCALAWLYVRYGTLPRARWLFYGMQPMIIAIVLQALAGLSRFAVKSLLLGFIAVAAAVLGLLNVDEIVILFGAGAIAAAARFPPRDAAMFVPLGGLFASFLKIGALLYGSGYVLLAFLRSDLVEKRHWIDETQLLDAITAGQITPGPVFTTATFIGYLVRGPAGAAVATLGIFLPAFVLVAASGPLVPRIRRSPRAGAFLDGVNAASLGLMAAVTARLGITAIVDVPSAILGIAGAFVLFRWKPSSLWLLPVGAIAGAIIQSLR